MSTSKKGKNNSRTWSMLLSLRLNITLLIVIALVSILGTVIPQGDAAKEFGMHLNPWTFKLFNTLGLFDTYHSTWFIALGAMLCLNLIVCSIKDFRSSWRILKKRILPAIPKNKKGYSLTIPRANTEQLGTKIENILRERYKRVEKRDSGGSVLFYGEKGSYAKLFVHLVHVAVLVIVLGAAFGTMFGFEGYVEVAKGQYFTKVYTKDNQEKDLGFSVHCDDFQIKYYDNGMPKEYRSDLSFIVNNKVVKKASIIVNHPAKFMGIRFYQSNYRDYPEASIRIKKNPDGIKTVKVRAGSVFKLPNDETFIHVLRVDKNLMGMGPAVEIGVHSHNSWIQFFVLEHIEKLKERIPQLFERFPNLNPSSFKPYTFYLDGIRDKYYTGIMVNKDPGIPVVGLGGVIIIAGLLLTFTYPQKRIWIKIARDSEGINFTVVATGKTGDTNADRPIKELLENYKGGRV